jgi:hypothetical protein
MRRLYAVLLACLVIYGAPVMCEEPPKNQISFYFIFFLFSKSWMLLLVALQRVRYIADCMAQQSINSVKIHTRKETSQ